MFLLHEILKANYSTHISGGEGGTIETSKQNTKVLEEYNHYLTLWNTDFKLFSVLGSWLSDCKIHRKMLNVKQIWLDIIFTFLFLKLSASFFVFQNLNRAWYR